MYVKFNSSSCLFWKNISRINLKLLSPKIETAPKVGIESKKEIFKESSLENFKPNWLQEYQQQTVFGVQINNKHEDSNFWIFSLKFGQSWLFLEFSWNHISCCISFQGLNYDWILGSWKLIDFCFLNCIEDSVKKRK